MLLWLQAVLGGIWNHLVISNLLLWRQDCFLMYSFKADEQTWSAVEGWLQAGEQIEPESCSCPYNAVLVCKALQPLHLPAHGSTAGTGCYLWCRSPQRCLLDLLSGLRVHESNRVNYSIAAFRKAYTVNQESSFLPLWVIRDQVFIPFNNLCVSAHAEALLQVLNFRRRCSFLCENCLKGELEN